DESGRPTLYVQPYPGPGARVTVTSEGPPAEPAWSKSGSEIFYRSGQRIFSVRFRVVGTEFVPEKPMLLFQQAALGAGTTVRATYDVTANGKFLLNQGIQELSGERNIKIFPSRLRFILNWDVETARLLREAQGH